MSNLIEGIFDELALIGVDAGTSVEITEYYKEWRTYRDGQKVNEV
jgi:hypothetical protein